MNLACYTLGICITDRANGFVIKNIMPWYLTRFIYVQLPLGKNIQLATEFRSKNTVMVLWGVCFPEHKQVMWFFLQIYSSNLNPCQLANSHYTGPKYFLFKPLNF